MVAIISSHQQFRRFPAHYDVLSGVVGTSSLTLVVQCTFWQVSLFLLNDHHHYCLLSHVMSVERRSEVLREQWTIRFVCC